MQRPRTERLSSTVGRTYEDFQPEQEWKQEENSEIHAIKLPGFKKEQLRVQMDYAGSIRITGERPVEGNKWIRFRKDIRLPQNTSLNDIRAKFENETLYLTMPKSKPAKPSPDEPTKPVTKDTPTLPPRQDKEVPEKPKDEDKDKETTESDQKEKVASAAEVESKPQGPVESASADEISRGEQREKKEEKGGKEEQEQAEKPTTGEAVLEKPRWKRNGSGLVGIEEMKKLVLGAVLAVLVALIVGMYMAYKHKSPQKVGE